MEFKGKTMLYCFMKMKCKQVSLQGFDISYIMFKV